MRHVVGEESEEACPHLSVRVRVCERKRGCERDAAYMHSVYVMCVCVCVCVCV